MYKIFFVGLTLLGFAYLTTTATARGTNPERTLNTISIIDSQVAHMGRFEKAGDGGARIGYPGVSFYVAFEGKELGLEAQSSGNQSHLEVIVDNEPPKVIKLSSSPAVVNLVKGDATQKHQVTIVHRGETWHGIVTLKRLHTDGKFLAAPALPKHKMLILGDSVTCGEAIERAPEGKKDSSWWNPSLSYGMLTAKALNAQVQLVCMGGHGLIRSWDGKTNELNLPDYYELAIPDQSNPVSWDQSQYQPDVIVSAIGTNDFSKGIPDRELYVAAYVKLLLKLLGDHKQAQIILTEGSILNGDSKTALTEYLHGAIKRTADKRVHYAAANYYPGDKADAHPTKEQHAAMANDLVIEVKKVMKW
jgi:lysophospholipase L1-like esterase